VFRGDPLEDILLKTLWVEKAVDHSSRVTEISPFHLVRNNSNPVLMENQSLCRADSRPVGINA